jgi:hypothetical protein
MKESLTVRLTPRMRYGLELLKRRNHETLTKTLRRILDEEVERYPGLEQIIEEIWDVDENTRIRKMGQYYPELLTFEEEVWLKENPNKLEKI